MNEKDVILNVDKKSRIPLYLQLTEFLIDKIESKEIGLDEKLPSERELCEIHNLSRITVRQALQELERDGYIYKLHGKGTFVSPQTFNQNLVKLYSFTDEMKKIGKVPSTEVLSFKEMILDERLSLKMNLPPYQEVFQVIRVRYADDEPLMYETSYLPKNIFTKLTESDLRNRPMYEVFSDDYQISVTRAIESFSATNLRNEESSILHLAPAHPAMLVKRFAYSEDNLVEYTVSVARGDKFDYTVELS